MGYFVKQSGQVTYNAGTDAIEYFDSTTGKTVQLTRAGSVAPAIDSILTAGASAGPYTISIDYGAAGDYNFDINNPAYIIVFLDGAYQIPVTSYSVTDATLTFTSVPPDGLAITVIHGTYSTFVPGTNVFPNTKV